MDKLPAPPTPPLAPPPATTPEWQDAPTAPTGHALVRLLVFVQFTLTEYLRSGRIWVEVGAALACYLVFLRTMNGIGIEPEQFFLIVGLFMLGLAVYTMSSMLALGDRPQGYVVLVRQPERASYLIGLFLSAMLVLVVAYSVLSLLTALLGGLAGLGIRGWLLGSLPLLLNVGLMAALLLLLSPLVLSTGWRLFVLSLIALAFSSSFFGSAQIDSFAPLVQNILRGVQTILSWPLVPAFSGFALAISRDYSGAAFVIPVAQIALLIALLTLALYTFGRRELMLSNIG